MIHAIFRLLDKRMAEGMNKREKWMKSSHLATVIHSSINAHFSSGSWVFAVLTKEMVFNMMMVQSYHRTCHLTVEIWFLELNPRYLTCFITNFTIWYILICSNHFVFFTLNPMFWGYTCVFMMIFNSCLFHRYLFPIFQYIFIIIFDRLIFCLSISKMFCFSYRKSLFVCICFNSRFMFSAQKYALHTILSICCNECYFWMIQVDHRCYWNIHECYTWNESNPNQNRVKFTKQGGYSVQRTSHSSIFSPWNDLHNCRCHRCNE